MTKRNLKWKLILNGLDMVLWSMKKICGYNFNIMVFR